MKVLLISPNIESLPDPVFPLGAAYIAAALKAGNIPCRVLDLCFVADYAAAITSAIGAFEPDLIGLSLRNFDNVSYPDYVSYLPFFRRVVETVRTCSRAPVVLGGSGFALMPREIMDWLGADFGITGEAETAIVDLVNRLAGTTAALPPPRGSLIDATAAVLEDLDRLPVADRSGFDGAAYLRFGGMGNIQTKRGCPFGCIYCTYPIIEGKTVRLRSPAAVGDEMAMLRAAGIETLFVVDNEFNYPIAHAERICREIIQRRIAVKWSCYANPKFVTPRLVELMAAAGCSGIEFGSDAAHPAILKNMGKNFGVGDIARASRICRRQGMPFCHSLLAGGPGETPTTLGQTFDTIDVLSPTAVICMIGIRVFPGTALAALARQERVVGPETDFLKPVFYLSPAIEDTVLDVAAAFSKTHPNWIFPGLHININPGLQKKLRRFGVKGPLWEHMRPRGRSGRGETRKGASEQVRRPERR